MPQFRTTADIFTNIARNEIYDDPSFDPERTPIPWFKEWDYKRELRLEDVDIWEVIAEASGGKGLYASHLPYAEFYLLTTGLDTAVEYRKPFFETFYGANAQLKAAKAAINIGLKISFFNTWIPPHEAWLFTHTANN
jgi:hypothetical protein